MQKIRLAKLMTIYSKPSGANAKQTLGVAGDKTTEISIQLRDAINQVTYRSGAADDCLR